MTVRGRGTLCTSPEVCSLLREMFVYVCERDVRERQAGRPTDRQTDRQKRTNKHVTEQGNSLI